MKTIIEHYLASKDVHANVKHTISEVEDSPGMYDLHTTYSINRHNTLDGLPVVITISTLYAGTTAVATDTVVRARNGKTFLSTINPIADLERFI